MDENLSMPLSTLIDEFSLEKIYMPENAEKVRITSTDVNRPALQLAGFFEYFDNSRIQVIGMVEKTFLDRFTSDRRYASLDRLMETKFPVLIVSRGMDIFPELLEAARLYKVPVLRTAESTSNFMSSLIAGLHVHLAPRITRHGVLVEVYGEGLLIIGESGVGKSETAVELIKRGHRLIADDAVEIKRVSDKTLVGSAPDIIMHFMELRGIGVIDVSRLFGMGAIKYTQGIDLVIQLENWDENKSYDRLGLETHYYEILGIKIPTITIPVRPGRNLAVVLEIAAMNHRQKLTGVNAAEELNERMMRKAMGADAENAAGGI